jgi:hypothetical protein
MTRKMTISVIEKRTFMSLSAMSLLMTSLKKEKGFSK